MHPESRDGARTTTRPLVKSKSSYGSMRGSRASLSRSSSSTSSTNGKDQHHLHQPSSSQQQPQLAAYVHSTSLKCVVLLLCSALGFGSNYCFHSPAALKNQLQQHFSSELQKDQFEVLFVSFPLA